MAGLATPEVLVDTVGGKLSLADNLCSMQNLL